MTTKINFKLFFLFGVVILLDQLSKQWAIAHHLSVLNSGISFGWWGSASWITTIMLSVFAAIVIIWLHASLFFKSSIITTIFSAAIISNLIDRWWRGGVLDWMQIPFTPIKNNLADWALTLSILIWIAKMITENRKKNET